MLTSDDVVINPTKSLGRRPMEARGTEYKIVVTFFKKTTVLGDNAPTGTYVMDVVVPTTATINVLITRTNDIVYKKGQALGWTSIEI